MKAILCEQFGLPESLVYRDIEPPLLKENQVVIAVEACGVNFPDLLVIQNKYQLKPELPFSPGGEVVGKVIQVGKSVGKFIVGDRVLALCSWGGLAELVAVDENRVFKLKEGIDPVKAASILYNYGTSFHALKDRANLKGGDRLLVLGATGGVGLAAVELGKIMGAKVIAAASSEEKLKLCVERGADEIINYKQEDLKQRVKELTSNEGVDVIFDPVGGKFTEQAFRAVAWGGRHLIVGFANGEIPKIPMNLPLLKGAAVVGVFWGQFSKVQVEQNLSNLEQLQDWMVEGKINGPQVQKYSLPNASDALHALMDRSKSNKGVVVL
ncbi:NADPH:quinone oxidoreductase family protein [Algoriphagus aestuarii]|nr:NADPH:quinone oxidoreductase family protein [Algoriphagus aestuarii]